MKVPAEKIHDVAVIGAGPGGCAAARALAQKGFSVLILEKAALPRYKTCGGGVLTRACKMLPCDIASVTEREFHSLTLNFSGHGLSFTARRSEPLVHMTMRADLDHLLANEAKRSGAHLIESCLVKNVTPQANFVSITAGNEEFRAQFVIAADGVHSQTAKTNGWSSLPCLAPALEWEIHLPEKDFARFSAVARFDFDWIQAGYAWVFPKRDHLSVGILSTRRTTINLAARLENYLAGLGIRRILKAGKHGYLIPLAPRREPLARGRILLVGDAAGLADPITAEGISYAIQSGHLAATALAECHLDVSRVDKHYQSLVEKNILHDLRAGRFLANILYNYPRIRNRAFRWQGQRLTDFVGAVVMGESGYADALKNPSSYFKMLGFGKTPAETLSSSSSSSNLR